MIEILIGIVSILAAIGILSQVWEAASQKRQESTEAIRQVVLPLRYSSVGNGLAVAIAGVEPRPDDTLYFTFDFACEYCGGFVLNVDDPDNPDSFAYCKACGRAFGAYGDIQSKAKALAEKAFMQGSN